MFSLVCLLIVKMLHLFLFFFGFLGRMFLSFVAFVDAVEILMEVMMILETRHLHVYALFHEMIAIHVWDVLNCRSLRMMKLALHYCCCCLLQIHHDVIKNRLVPHSKQPHHYSFDHEPFFPL